MSKSILLTGGSGFVGASLAIKLKEKYPSYKIICLDNLKRRGSELNIPRLQEREIKFIHGDIRNSEDFENAGEIDVLIDAAAEPSVMAGLSGDIDYLVNTNFNGTINSLNFAKEHNAAFIFLSTSRVYPIREISNINYFEGDTRFEIHSNQSLIGITSNGIGENFSLNGSRSLYGASKLASELFVNEFQSYFEMKTVINRCGVLTGPYQMGKVDQGVIVLWAARHFWKRPLSYIGYGGNGKQVRDLLHVDDLFGLLDWQIHNIEKVSGKTFNVGGGKDISISLKELTDLCLKISGNKIDISKVKENRQGDIPIYVTDNRYVNETTGWSPKISAEQILNEVFAWLEKNETILKPILF
ncbi:MAG: NAD-dependent epimerase/dehydratase family protein [Cyclobacteriaceae bacterium]